jgi:hypothetical protein
MTDTSDKHRACQLVVKVTACLYVHACTLVVAGVWLAFRRGCSWCSWLACGGREARQCVGALQCYIVPLWGASGSRVWHRQRWQRQQHWRPADKPAAFAAVVCVRCGSCKLQVGTTCMVSPTGRDSTTPDVRMGPTQCMMAEHIHASMKQTDNHCHAPGLCHGMSMLTQSAGHLHTFDNRGPAW